MNTYQIYRGLTKPSKDLKICRPSGISRVESGTGKAIAPSLLPAHILVMAKSGIAERQEGWKEQLDPKETSSEHFASSNAQGP